MGIIYTDTEKGRSYAALEDAKSLARDSGYEIVACNAIDGVEDIKIPEAEFMKCVDEIIPKIDAIYIINHQGVAGRIVDIQAALSKAKIPSFSQMGSDQVRYGLLMSIAQTTRKHEGKVTAQKLAQVLNGAKPRLLSQLVDDPQRIAINMKTAALIGFEPTIDLLELVDETYKEIENPPPHKK